MQPMQRRTESTSTLETRLASVLIGELVGRRGLRLPERRREGEAYASFEIVCEAAPADDAAKTIKFLRDPTEDYVTTVKFVREAMDADDRGTIPFVRYSAPYELIDIQPSGVTAPKTPRRVAVVERAAASYGSTSFVRSTDAHERDTLRFVRYTAPYELIDIQQTSQAFVKTTNELPDDAITAIEDNRRAVLARPVLILSLLLGALAFGVAVGFLAS